MTKEEKKEQQRLAKNAYMRDYAKRNKEKKKAYDLIHRKENKEYIASRAKKYREENKEELAAKALIHYAKNRDSKLAYFKEYNDRPENKSRRKQIVLNEMDGYYVYYLKEEHYVGQTKNMRRRMNGHKSDAKRHILDVEVLAKFETRKEALAYEAKLHSMGYEGAHPQSK